jgi:WD40 repeat protein
VHTCVKCCAWSPDGTHLVCAINGTNIVASNVPSCLYVLGALGIGGGAGRDMAPAPYGTHLNNCVWSPDGSQLASALSDRTVRVWDVGTGHEVEAWQILLATSKIMNRLTKDTKVQSALDDVADTQYPSALAQVGQDGAGELHRREVLRVVRRCRLTLSNPR